MKIRILLFILLVVGLEAASKRRNDLKSRTRQLLFPKSGENAWDDTGFGKVDKKKKSHHDLQNVKLNSNEQAETVIDNSSAQIVSNIRQYYPEFSNLNANQLEQTAIPNLLAESDQARPDDDQMLISGCLGARGQYPSPNNCANYLNCWDNTVIEQQCPTDLLFNEMTGLCDFEQNVNCGERPGPTPKPTLQPYARRCPDPNGRYKSQTNCSEFYVCLAGTPIKFSCPRGLVYNDRVSVCDYLYNVDCQGAVTPMPIWSHPVEYPDNSDNSSNEYFSSSLSMNFGNSSTIGISDSSYYDGSQFQETSRKPPQTTFPSGPYPQNLWKLRSLSEIEKQRSITIQSDSNNQYQPENGVTRDTTGYIQKDLIDASIVDNQQMTEHVIQNQWTKLSCENGKILRLDDTCSNVVVCKNHRPQLITCDPGFTYDFHLDACQNHTTAECSVITFGKFYE